MRPAQERTFKSFDQTELFYRAWLPADGLKADKSDKVLILFHRGHEHSGRLQQVVDDLACPDMAVFAWDQRGHGRSPGERGYANHLIDLVRDIDCFVRFLTEQYGLSQENMVVVGHSVAAVLVGLWVKNFAPRIRGMALITPALDIKLYVPFALPGLRFLLWATKALRRPVPFIKSYVKGRLLTHDVAQARAYDNDPLISKQIAVNILVQLYDAARDLLRDAGAIVTPTLLISARADWVVKNKPQRELFQRLSSPLKRVCVFRGMYHAVFHEVERAHVLDALRGFVQEVFAQPVDRRLLTQAHHQGYTYEEYQWLQAGLPIISLKRLGYVLQRAMMKTLGRLSQGIRIGWLTGFDSGESLDYVYRNSPSGSLGIGKMIDRQYLNSIGWRGIRQRKLNIEIFLIRAIELLRERGANAKVRIVDIAGGPGRYVLDVVKKLGIDSFDVLIRDISEAGLQAGQSIANSMGLSEVAYQRGDAFSEDSLRQISPQADVAIVSGLYELFQDNAMLENSLRGISQFVKTGGYLIYTNQPWHPQLEMIAEVLINRDHKPWVMRRRTQAEMDELVRAAGFQKEAMAIDNDGIFTVSLAKRV